MAHNGKQIFRINWQALAMLYRREGITSVKGRKLLTLMKWHLKPSSKGRKLLTLMKWHLKPSSKLILFVWTHRLIYSTEKIVQFDDMLVHILKKAIFFSRNSVKGCFYNRYKLAACKNSLRYDGAIINYLTFLFAICVFLIYTHIKV